MNNTLIAGPHNAQQVGALDAYARTVSYSHRIRAIARTAAHKETKDVVSNGNGVGPRGTVSSVEPEGCCPWAPPVHHHPAE